jgi:LDH2 family malate/lactate/ureidoglycolate dehydrogenase
MDKADRKTIARSIPHAPVDARRTDRRPTPAKVSSRMSIGKLERLMVRLLCAAGMRPPDASAVAWVYAAMTLRDVGHHDVTGFPGLLGQLARGGVKARPRIRVVVDRGAVAVLEGDAAPGPLAAYRMTEKAIEKAARWGIGMACVRNSNHFVGAAAYALMAARRGMIGIVASNAGPGMGTGASRDLAIGNNPWGFACLTGAGFPLMLDICNAYASYGKLHEYKAAGRKLPRGWGLDRQGRPTVDPAAVIGGVPMPIAGHKGLGLSMLVELLTGVLSDGAILDELRYGSKGGNGPCQAAIVINVKHFLPLRRFQARTRKMVISLKEHPLLDRRRPTLLPGERSNAAAKRIRKEGVRLDPETASALGEWCVKLGVRG